MKFLRKFSKPLYGNVYHYYQLEQRLNLLHLPEFAKKLDEHDLSPANFRISNDHSGFDGYFRIFPSMKEFLMYCPDNNDEIYIDDFGADVVFSGTKYSLTLKLPNTLTIMPENGCLEDAFVTTISNIIDYLNQ